VERVPVGTAPFVSLSKTARHGRIGEIIIMTLPQKTSKWLRRV
jgi:hypothetical protein